MIGRTFRVVRFIVNHPFAGKYKWRFIKRFLSYQIGKLFNSHPIVYPFTNKTQLIVEHNMSGATGNIYAGLHEFEDMGFLLHLLRREDLFVDVGANIGSYTVLASGHVGCKTISIEPVPASYKRLKNNLAINFLESKVVALNIALGSERGQLNITTDQDTVNHIQAEEDKGEILKVPVDILENIVKERVPALIKIDVEGFETEVLKGAKSVLMDNSLIGVIIELNGSGDRYGYDETKIRQDFLANGFMPYTYDPFTRILITLNSPIKGNTIYIRDIKMANERIRNATPFIIGGISV